MLRYGITDPFPQLVASTLLRLLVIKMSDNEDVFLGSVILLNYSLLQMNKKKDLYKNINITGGSSLMETLKNEMFTEHIIKTLCVCLQSILNDSCV